MSIIEEIEHNDSHRGMLASLEGADRVKGRQAKREGSPGISDALVVGAGVGIYQSLLPISKEEDLRGIINGAVNTADTSAGEDRPDSSTRTKHVRIKTEPELLERLETVPGSTSFCPSPSLDGRCGNHTMLTQEQYDPHPDLTHRKRKPSSIHHIRIALLPQEMLSDLTFGFHNFRPVTPSYRLKTLINICCAISSVWYKDSRSLYAE